MLPIQAWGSFEGKEADEGTRDEKERGSQTESLLELWQGVEGSVKDEINLRNRKGWGGKAKLEKVNTSKVNGR